MQVMQMWSFVRLIIETAIQCVLSASHVLCELMCPKYIYPELDNFLLDFKYLQFLLWEMGLYFWKWLWWSQGSCVGSSHPEQRDLRNRLLYIVLKLFLHVNCIFSVFHIRNFFMYLYYSAIWLAANRRFIYYYHIAGHRVNRWALCIACCLKICPAA